MQPQDEIARFNQRRWQALADADALYTRPALNLDRASAHALADPQGWLGEVAGLRVLLLGGGGGQQSAAFGLLGAQVTVVDLSAAQLERDRLAADHYGVPLRTVQADMRDLSAAPARAFDVVVQPYSINFVPDARAVFQQVRRLLRPDGRYLLQFANPLVLGVKASDWTGAGYPLTQLYQDGAPVVTADEAWVCHPRDDGSVPDVPPPREYRHTLSTIVNGLVTAGFSIRRLADQVSIYPDPDAAPGSWDHFVAVAPPWLVVLCQYQPA
jgi:SAM-dependent methyltransferase